MATMGDEEQGFDDERARLKELGLDLISQKSSSLRAGKGLKIEGLRDKAGDLLNIELVNQLVGDATSQALRARALYGAIHFYVHQQVRSSEPSQNSQGLAIAYALNLNAIDKEKAWDGTEMLLSPDWATVERRRDEARATHAELQYDDEYLRKKPEREGWSYVVDALVEFSGDPPEVLVSNLPELVSDDEEQADSPGLDTDVAPQESNKRSSGRVLLAVAAITLVAAVGIGLLLTSGGDPGPDGSQTTTSETGVDPEPTTTASTKGPSSDLTLLVLPPAGGTTTQFRLEASGFTPRSEVLVSVANPDGTPYPLNLPTLPIDDAGSYATDQGFWWWTWSDGEQLGTYTLTFTDALTGESVATEFTIR